jgi:HK97 family phage major capsid protein
MANLFDMDALQQQATEKFAEAKAIAAQWKGQEAAMPIETAEHLRGLLADVKTVRSRIEMGNDLADLAGPAAPPKGFAGARPAGDTEGIYDIDTKSYREIEIKSAWGETINYRFHLPLKVQRKGYSGAFEGYLHKGIGSLTQWDQKNLSEGTDTSGGFLVPEQVMTDLIRKQMTMAVIRSNASVMQIGRDVVSFPKVNYGTASDDTSGYLYSQPMRPTATGEIPSSSTVHAVTSVTWGKVTIPVQTVMASEIVYNDFLEDEMIDVGNFLSDAFGEFYALYEENQFINGTGINAPMGILTQVDTSNGPTSVVSGTTSSPYFLYTGIINLEAALPSQYEPNAKFIARKGTYSNIRLVTTATTNEPLWPISSQQGYLGTVPPSLLGYPILKSEFMPLSSTGNANALLLGDLTAYQIVDRVGLSIQRLDELLADQNARKFVARKRFGGQLTKPWKLVVSKTST